MSTFSDPVVLFNAAMAALASRDAEAFGECFDPVSVAQLRRQVLQGIRRAPHPMTLDDYRGGDPEMPREVAEYFLSRAQQPTSIEARLKAQFPDVESIEVLEAMSPGRFYLTYVEAHGVRRQVERLVADGRLPAAALDSIRKRELVAIGSVLDGDRIALVLYRDRFDEGEVSKEWLEDHPQEEREMAWRLATRGHVRIQPCYRQPDGGWKLIADFTAFGRGSMSISVAPRPTS
jgi:hypothetical protein